MISATPSSTRSQTARVASGVTSRGAIPVPPLVTTKRAAAASSRKAEAIRSTSSGTILLVTTSKPAVTRAEVSRGPEASSRVEDVLFGIATGFIEQAQTFHQQTLRRARRALLFAAAGEVNLELSLSP